MKIGCLNQRLVAKALMTRLSQWVNTCRPCSSRGTREGRTCRNEIDFVQELKQGPKFKLVSKDVLRNKKQKKRIWKKNVEKGAFV